jgi:hypothetical protein
VSVVDVKGSQSVMFARDSLIDDSMEDDDRNNPLLHLAVVPSGTDREIKTSKRSRLTLVPLHLEEEDGVSTNLANLPVSTPPPHSPRFVSVYHYYLYWCCTIMHR